MAALLLGRNASVEALTEDGETALITAAGGGQSPRNLFLVCGLLQNIWLLNSL